MRFHSPRLPPEIVGATLGGIGVQAIESYESEPTLQWLGRVPGFGVQLHCNRLRQRKSICSHGSIVDHSMVHGASYLNMALVTEALLVVVPICPWSWNWTQGNFISRIHVDAPVQIARMQGQGRVHLLQQLVNRLREVYLPPPGQGARFGVAKRTAAGSARLQCPPIVIAARPVSRTVILTSRTGFYSFYILARFVHIMDVTWTATTIGKSNLAYVTRT
ncbi:hypothetical protein FB451DRAFT_1176083 [Mycena latifolia]|nr:hypothetical protein FB451DRAFT_1176083 [Mycena latifolia]